MRHTPNIPKAVYRLRGRNVLFYMLLLSLGTMKLCDEFSAFGYQGMKRENEHKNLMGNLRPDQKVVYNRFTHFL